MRLWVVAALCVACGSDQNPADGGPADASIDVAPIPAPFGLDSRPANTTCKAPPRPATSAISVKLDPIFPTLTFSLPVGLFQAPGDSSRFFVLQKGGRVRVFDNVATPTVTDFIDITTRVNSAPNEAGLLGFAFDPDWPAVQEVFLSYDAYDGASAANLESRVSRFKSKDAGKTLDPADETFVFSGIHQPYTNHNGGCIAFGKDKLLYFGLGDGGSGGDPLNNGQNQNTFFGKILRVDPRGGAPYSIPSDNPFAGSTTQKQEIFAYGFRNPWRFSFDKDTGELWVGDVGQNAWEEIDDKVKKGGNYGWRYREGKHCYNPATGCPTVGLIDPIVEYDHGQGVSITGGYVYRGKAIPSLVGTYIFADFGSGRIWAIIDDGKNPASIQQIAQGANISSFGQDNDGELYVTNYGTGKLFKLVPDVAPPPPAFPDALTKTGCVEAGDATKPATGLIPYGVNAALWSDGAEKQRHFAIPDGTTIAIGTDGDLDLPIGSVAMKTFVVAGKRVETRLLVRHDDGDWAGYTYEWNDAQTDATLLPSSKTTSAGWYIPTRAECLRCHTTAAGRSLGLEIGQLNGDFVYPNNRLSNQVKTLDHIGMFTTPPGDPTGLVRYPTVTGPDPAMQRARAYLHANCSMCHRPGSLGGGNMNFLYATDWKTVNVCNVDPTLGNLGVTGAKLVLPGDPTKSIVSLRTHATDANRMPPLATKIVDTNGTKAIDDAILPLTSCP